MSTVLNWLFALVVGLLFGGVVHIASLLAVPYLAPRDAYSRLASLGGANAFIALDAEDPARRLPMLDPAFVSLACRFDLTSGPVEVRAPIAGDYVSMSFYGRDGVAFFSLNDRSALGASIDVELHDAGDQDFKIDSLRPGAIPVASLDLQGIVIVRAFAPTASTAGVVKEALPKAVCGPAQPR